ncbi:hypothetical protein BOTBODRAFT_180218 [Botryobasidium botryosum FD-172 SS1]|uniref:Uncharacterized protein n=1 Tax=Botryobasidium botryosum (strain FD-172 SS1) TaxID=930990 RepID=A0A067M910_BOTB1|nr:hypothetical protein BOTBODRAFT_180218 [Botryobasidium botryosum FD-172 SS1]
MAQALTAHDARVDPFQFSRRSTIASHASTTVVVVAALAASKPRDIVHLGHAPCRRHAWPMAMPSSLQPSPTTSFLSLTTPQTHSESPATSTPVFSQPRDFLFAPHDTILAPHDTALSSQVCSHDLRLPTTLCSHSCGFVSCGSILAAPLSRPSPLCTRLPSIFPPRSSVLLPHAFVPVACKLTPQLPHRASSLPHPSSCSRVLARSPLRSLTVLALPILFLASPSLVLATRNLPRFPPYSRIPTLSLARSRVLPAQPHVLLLSLAGYSSLTVSLHHVLSLTHSRVLHGPLASLLSPILFPCAVLAPLQLINFNTFVHDISLGKRNAHQVKFIVGATRQRGRILRTASSTPSLGDPPPQRHICDQIRERLAHLMSSDAQAGGSTAGVSRVARHMGQVTIIGGNADNKRILHQVKAESFMCERELYFSRFRIIHPAAAHANISTLMEQLCLQPGSFMIAYHCGNVFIGEVITIYTKTATKGAKHEWTPKVTNLGQVSNLGIQLCVPLDGTSFTTVACPMLGCATFLLVPTTHLLFSISPSIPTKQHITTGSRRWVNSGAEIQEAIQTLVKALKLPKA